MKLKIFQKGFNYSQDGPGNRLVFHLLGCNMHCPWCSNPDGMSINANNYTALTCEEIVEEALISKPMFFDGGGVTFTGGECTLQFEALKSTLIVLKEKRINTAIETNGTHKNFAELIPYTDHIIIDYKHPNNDILKKITGVSNEVIKQNILLASQKSKSLLIRIPLINGFNTSEENFEEFTAFFKTLNKDNICFEILKYHEYGKDKWKKLGLTYTVKNAFVDENTRTHFEELIKKEGLKIIRT